MNNTISIKLKKNRSIYKKLIYYILYFYLFSGMIIDMFGFPKIIQFLGDFLNLFLFALVVFKKKTTKVKSFIKIENIIIFFIIATIISTIINISLKSVIQYIWAARNYFRYFMFFYSCYCVLSINDYERIMDKLKKLFYFCALIVFYQHYIMGRSGDDVGGIFGIVSGCNGRLNVFISIVFSYVLLCYFEKKETFVNVGVVSVLCFAISVFAELKVFYVEFVIISLICMLLTQMSFKKIAIGIGAILLIVVAASWLESMYDYSGQFSGGSIFSIDYFVWYLTKDTGYDGYGGDLNRLTAIPELIRMYFQNNMLAKLFGIGFGNADYSNSLSLFTSSFVSTTDFPTI